MAEGTKINKLTVIALSLITLGCGGCGSSSSDNALEPGAAMAVLAGRIDRVPESRGIFVWGESLNQLCQQWSIALFDQSGWFYGTGSPTSSADVYVLAAPTSPLSVVAAENFAYTSGNVQAREGDTVFFRGRNGFFGAWTITVVEGAQGAVLSGDWYFKAGGGGDFTGIVLNSNSSNYDAGAGVCDGY